MYIIFIFWVRKNLSNFTKYRSTYLVSRPRFKSINICALCMCVSAAYYKSEHMVLIRVEKLNSNLPIELSKTHFAFCILLCFMYDAGVLPSCIYLFFDQNTQSIFLIGISLAYHIFVYLEILYIPIHNFGIIGYCTLYYA